MWFFIGIVITFAWIWIISEIVNPLEEGFTAESETHLIVDGDGKLIETASYKIHSV